VLERAFEIAGRRIGDGAAPFVIAEAGSNFNQDYDTARALIDVAAEARVDAVKFQLFKAESLYARDSDMYATFKSVELPAEWLANLARHASARGLIFLASGFDLGSLAALEEIGVPAHKVASSETTNLRLLAAMARTGKPLLVSTGMCDGTDIAAAVEVCVGVGNHRLTLLQCGSVYPLPPEHANLRVMDVFAAQYGCPVGYSDHTLGTAAAIAAVARGAAVVEKHFTLDRSASGPDHFYALEPDELKRFAQDLREAHLSLGTGLKEMLPEERKYGRRDGLWAARDVAAGERLSANDIAVRRPALGLRARYAAIVIGAPVRRAIAKGTPIDFEDIEL
jgi:sialic acid synthase SpsE